MAGILYGVNIAVTGVYAKRFYVPLYLIIQTFIETVFSFFTALALDFSGIEKIKFSFDVRLITLSIAVVLITSTLCWLIRTYAMRHIAATVVAVMMPFSSVITAVSSIIFGKDKISLNLVIGVIMGLVAIILSSLGDKPKENKKKAS